MIEVGNVGKFFAQTQCRVLSIDGNRGLKRAKVSCEVEMLILREMLIGKDQDCVLGEGVFDPVQIRGVNWRRQVDVANFGSEAWRDRIDGDGHDHALELSPCRKN